MLDNPVFSLLTKATHGLFCCFPPLHNFTSLCLDRTPHSQFNAILFIDLLTCQTVGDSCIFILGLHTPMASKSGQ